MMAPANDRSSGSSTGKYLLIVLVSTILSGCSLVADLAPSKSTVTDVHDWLVVPIFYATNRAKAQGAKQIEYLEEPSGGARAYGVKNIVIPKPDDVTISPQTMNRMGWQVIHLDKPLPHGKKPEVSANNKVADSEMTGAEVIKNFDKYRSDSGSDELVLFVHGCCATFDTSLDRAAKIVARMQVPVAIYDWVSPKSFRRYLENETLAEQSLDDFDDLLEKIERVVRPERTTLIGHSMGAHFLDNALSRRFERSCGGNKLSQYKEVIFCNADIDAQSYINHNQQIAANTGKVRIYMSTVDGRLDASAMAHGNYDRLGRPGDLLARLCKVDRQDVIDISQLGLDHEMPFWLVADLHRNDKLSPNKNFDCFKQGQHMFIIRKKQLAAGASVTVTAKNDQPDCCGRL